MDPEFIRLLGRSERTMPRGMLSKARETLAEKESGTGTGC
jgi:hypothetical protein